MKYDGKELIGFFKGTAGEFNKLMNLAPSLMAAAAEMRNELCKSPYQVSDFKHD